MMSGTLRHTLWRRRWLTADAVDCTRHTNLFRRHRHRHCARLHTFTTLHTPQTTDPSTTRSASCSTTTTTTTTTKPNLIDLLSSRGFISSTTHPLPQLRAHFATPRTVYAGFDPTAPSLHLGNLLVLLALSWAQHCGHRVVAVVGGGTGLVGDPSGREKERQRMTEERLGVNMAGIEGSMRQILQPSALVVNNLDWLRDLPLLTFLRDIGSQYRIATLLSKASVQSRLASSSPAAPSAGLSYTEFSYQLLQGYDWLQLYDRYECTVQFGGSDQWGNITSGMELIAKLRPTATAIHGLTLPLLTTASGQKLGKSANNALWLDPRLTSPYALYQHLLHTEDGDVGRYMRLLTRVEAAEIERLEAGGGGGGGLEARGRVQLLAREVVRVVHGAEGVAEAERQTAALWSGDGKGGQAAAEAASERRRRSEVLGKNVVQLAVELKAVASKSECKRLIASGGLYLNGERVPDDKRLLTADDLSTGVLLLRVGKQQQHAVSIVDG